MSYYAWRVETGRELAISRRLERLGGKPFVPQLSDGSVMLPGYVIAEFWQQPPWPKVQRVRGVIRPLDMDGKPATIPEAQIADLSAMARDISRMEQRQRRELAAGDVAVVIGGPLDSVRIKVDALRQRWASFVHRGKLVRVPVDRLARVGD